MVFARVGVSMDDEKGAAIPQPVISPADAWHLSQGQAFERATRLVRDAGSIAGNMRLDEFTEEVAKTLAAEADKAWRSYLVRSNHAMPIDEGSPDLHVEFDKARDVPVVYLQEDEGACDGWGIVDLETRDQGEAGLMLATPFRQVDLSRLPSRTHVVKLEDAKHAATAAIAEVLAAACRDIKTAFIAKDAAQAWRRLQQVLQTYRLAAKVALEKLGEDDFHHWSRLIPSKIEIGSGAGLICQLATTSRGQLALATHLVASWIQTMADRLEREHGPAAAELLVEQVSSAHGRFSGASEAMNTVLAVQHGHAPSTFTAMVIFRPVPGSIPVLAITLSGDVDNILPIGGKK